MLSQDPTIVAYLGLGSNLGDRQRHIRAAILVLAQSTSMHFDSDVDLAGVYETRPIDVPATQPDFLNTVLRVRTTLSAPGLLGELLAAEQLLGRVRTEPRSARTIDLDLLLYGDEVMETPDLIVPHPRLHERRFVLEPLAELAGDIIHPELGLSIRDLCQAAANRTNQPVRRLGELEWEE